MIKLTNEQKIDLISARNSVKPEPYRSIEQRLNIDHSTLHYMEPRIRTDIQDALKLLAFCPKKLIVKIILIFSLTGQMSSRSIAESIRLMYGKDVGHDFVLNVLSLSSEVSKKINHEKLDLTAVKTALFDEIFQSRSPILGFSDYDSAIILLESSNDRSSKSWSTFIDLLKNLGLQPESAITDGGSGLKSSLKLKFGKSIVYVLDLFHFLKKLLDAKKKMEGICYSLIKVVDDLINKGTDKRTKKYKQLVNKMNQAIDIFDQYESLYNTISKHVYLCNHQSGEYVDSNKLKDELLKIGSLLNKFYQKIRKHRKINEARSYVENNINQLIAYKQNIEKEICKEYPNLSPLIFKYFLPIIECLDRVQRSYEDSKSEKFWAEKIISLKKELLIKENISSNQFDELLNSVGKITSKFAKSNSLIENVNNQIRKFLDTYKSIPSWFCPLFSYYWNFRKFKRGKRKGFAPIELLTGNKLNKSWLDLILDNFPYEKIRTSLRALQSN